MQTVPERRSSGGGKAPQDSAMPEQRDAGAQSLQVVPKSCVGARENVVADTLFRRFVILCAVAIMAVVGLIVFELVRESRPSMVKFGFKFLTKQIWDPVAEDFGALPFIYGTIVSSMVALFIAVPLSVGTALFLTELCPRVLRGTLSL